MINVVVLDPKRSAYVGFIPGWLDKEDPRPAKEQLNGHYAHGGGWHPQGGFEVVDSYKLKFPGDPIMEPFAAMRLRKEIIFMYDFGYVAIFQPDGEFEVCRMD
jgi:hypothetical protein